jgi:WD40 repeat protein
MTSTLIPPQAFTNLFTFGEPKLHTDGEVLVVSFGKEGWLYSIEEMGILRKWNPDSGEQLEWHTLSDMESLWTFSADGRVLASASDDLTIWDATSGRLLTSIPQPSWVTALAFSGDPSFIATGHDDGAIGYWDAPGHHPVFEKGFSFHKKPISALAVSPNGKWLAAASEDKSISVWNLATGAYHGCLIGHTDRIPALAWHPSSNYLVSAGWDTTARIWDANTLQPVMILNAHANQVNAMAFSHDGHWLACADSSHAIHLWDFDTKKTTHKLKVPGAEIRTLAFSHDGKHLACNGDRIIHIWNPLTGKPYADLGPRPIAKTTVSVHCDGKSLASNAGGSAAGIWSTVSRQLVIKLEADEPIHALSFSPDGKWIAGSVGNQIRLWDASGKFIGDWDGPDEEITTLAFSPDSTTLASGSVYGDTVWVWRVADGEPILLIPDALNGCNIGALAFLPDSNHLAVGGIDYLATAPNDGAVSIWNLSERAEVTAFFEGTTALAAHPTGDILASTTLDHSICLWDLQLKKLVQEFTGHDGAITCLAFSPDGSWLVSGGEDHTLRIWDDKGHERALIELDSHATALAFSADGNSLFTAHANTTCRQWQLPDPFRSK